MPSVGIPVPDFSNDADSTQSPVGTGLLDSTYWSNSPTQL